MNITIKPLTAQVILNSDDSASITIKNESGNVALGPLTHFHVSERGFHVINDHLAQLIFNGVNIVKLETNISEITLPTQE